MWWRWGFWTPPPPPQWGNIYYLGGLTPSRVLYLCLLWDWCHFFIKTYVCQRQITVITRMKRVPPVLEEKICPEVFQQARKYNKHKISLEIWSSFYYVTLNTMFLFSGMLWKLWTWSGSFLDNLNAWPSHWDRQIGETIVLIIIGVCLFEYVQLPIRFTSAFIVDEMHGLNKQPLKLFVIDCVKKVFVSIGLAVPIGVGIMKIDKMGGDHSSTLMWMFCSLSLIIGRLVYSSRTTRFFHKYTLLEDGNLYERLKVLTNYCGLQLNYVWIKKESERRSQAHFLGRSKTLVLFDNLLANYSTDNKETYTKSDTDGDQAKCPKTYSLDGTRHFTAEEIEALVARELGHWKLHHGLWMLGISILNMFVIFFIFSYLRGNPVVYKAFGMRGSHKPILLGLYFVVTEMLGVFNFVICWHKIALNQIFEYEADKFAVHLGYGRALREAILKISVDNLHFPVTDRVYSCFYQTQPFVLERIQAINEVMRTYR